MKAKSTDIILLGSNAVMPRSILRDILPVAAPQHARGFHSELIIGETQQYGAIRIATQQSASKRPVALHHFISWVPEAVAIANGEYYQSGIHLAYKPLG